jgi:hypothetical protein
LHTSLAFMFLYCRYKIQCIKEKISNKSCKSWWDLYFMTHSNCFYNKWLDRETDITSKLCIMVFAQRTQKYLYETEQLLAFCDFIFSWWWRRWLWSSGLWHHVILNVVTGISEECTTLKMELICSSTSSVTTYETTSRHNPEDHDRQLLASREGFCSMELVR